MKRDVIFTVKFLLLLVKNLMTIIPMRAKKLKGHPLIITM